MSYPCVDPDHFVVDGDGALSPQPYAQWRHVATNSAGSVQKSYNTNGGNQAEDLVNFQVAWTNPGPMSMLTYALVTRGGASVKTGTRTRAYIAMYYGQASGVSPADPTASTLLGRMGSGLDGSTYTSGSTTYARWGTTEVRQAEHSLLVGPFVTLAPGQSLKTRIRLRWDADFWETLTYLVSGSGEAELAVMTGPTRLDLYAIPII
jgi:hypothetical protein